MQKVESSYLILYTIRWSRDALPEKEKNIARGIHIFSTEYTFIGCKLLQYRDWYIEKSKIRPVKNNSIAQYELLYNPSN